MINSKMLKDRAKELGIRQADIAAALGLRQSTVSQKISGDQFGIYFFSQAGGVQLNREEWSLIEKYRQLPRNQQLLMHALMMPAVQKVDK